MAVVAIGSALAYLTTQRISKRIAILVLAFLLALAANPVRVALIVYSYYSGLASPSQGHMWQGMVVSLGAFALLFWAVSLVEPPEQHEMAPPPAVRPDAFPVPWRQVSLLAVLSCVVFTVAGSARPLAWPVSSLDSLRLESIPTAVGEWRASPGFRPPLPARGVVQADELWREYRDPTGRSLRVYVGRFVHRVGTQGLRYLV